LPTLANQEREKKDRPKRFRPSPALYKFTHSALVRDNEIVYGAGNGELCALCHRKKGEIDPETGKPVRIEIDHADGRRETWVLGKLSLRCIRCNRSKFLASLPTMVSVNRERENLSSASWEAQRSVELAPTLRLELERLLGEESERGRVLTVIDAQNRLAKICGCDQQTVARFIDRETTEEGDFVLSERTVNDGRRKRTLQIIGWKTKSTS
jgi:hypothetical protein